MANYTCMRPGTSLESAASQQNLGNGAKGSFPMIEYVKTWLSLKADRRAVTALEYGLIAGVIVVTILAGFQVLATDLSNKFSNIGGSL